MEIANRKDTYKLNVGDFVNARSSMFPKEITGKIVHINENSVCIEYSESLTTPKTQAILDFNYKFIIELISTYYGHSERNRKT